jgi:alpha-galactosidase
VTFPSGMAALGRAIHAQGLKFGIYTSAGRTICLHPQPGSLGHYAQDFRTFASWKVDYVKVDWCSRRRVRALPGGG